MEAIMISPGRAEANQVTPPGSVICTKPTECAVGTYIHLECLVNAFCQTLLSRGMRQIEPSRVLIY